MKYYRTKVVVIEATQMTAASELNGQKMQAGDWLVVDEYGAPQAYTDEQFQALYEEAPRGSVLTRGAKASPKPPARPRRTRKAGLAKAVLANGDDSGPSDGQTAAPA